VRRKVDRLRRGAVPRVLDLFAGCGGISLGFQATGCTILGAVEMDAAAARSHALNFHLGLPPDAFEAHAKARDITQVEPTRLLAELGLCGSAEDQVDVVVGGPPCQAFARVGRAKLREVAAHPEAFLRDPRSNLYLRYLDYVRALQPVALLMENVPDVLNFGGHNVADEVCEVLEEMGYEPRYTLLNASRFGVPQMRERMILVAFRREVRAHCWLPQPSHCLELPSGYRGTRGVATQTVRRDVDGAPRWFVETSPIQSGREAVTAQAALGDLPVIKDDSPLKMRAGVRRFDTLAAYREAPGNSYQRLMRAWRGFESRQGVFDHVIRCLPRDYRIFRRMKPGDQYPEAHRVAMQMFETRLRQIERSEGRRPKEGSARHAQELAALVPPYDPDKFPNKWRKMEADRPARTLMAHLGKDSYSHIHYDSAQARTISVREAARLQSFPDGFVFQGPMNAAFRQIGNAVPPLLARAVAQVIRDALAGGHPESSERSGPPR
jgi:DNA (cytosine-5)-methyltransferase 1